MKKLFLFLFVIGLALNVLGQVPEMRTRLLPSLTNAEVETYLQRDDVIFIPVGATEVHGGFPLDCEYVAPLAYCIKMAEKVDALVLPNLTYFYPGATSTGRGTVHTDCIEGAEYLMAIAHSLLRQGFKTQIYITGHGPSYGFMEPFVYDFFHETQVPIVYMDQGALRGAVEGMDMNSMNTVMYGAYSIVNRLEDIPLSFEGVDLNDEDYEPMGTPEAVGNILHLPVNNSVQAVQWYYNSPHDHGGVPQPITAEERERLAEEGVKVIEAQVEAFDIEMVVRNMKEHQKFTDDMVKKYGNLLDFDN